MNRSPSGGSPKTNSSLPTKLLTSNNSNKKNTTPIIKNINSSSTKSYQPNKLNSKSAMTLHDKSLRLSNSSINHSPPDSPSKYKHQTTYVRSTDNTSVSADIASQLTHNNDSQSSTVHSINPTSIHTNTGMNFATVTATENTPSREQAIVFNSIDGIPQIEYILAIGKIVKPINIIFISRISNQRFCIFLSSKQVLDNLMQQTQTIKINDQLIQIRRLVNPTKRVVISNVCPSIPNRAILDALKLININPTTQINHLKAGINMEGYEHIMSFRRQVYINHEDIPKLPSSMLISQNDNQFRIFFSDDTLTCFLCKAVGHTSNNCKKNSEKNSTIEPIINTNFTNDIYNTKKTQPIPTEDDSYSLTSNSHLDGNQIQTITDWSLETTPEAPPLSDNYDELPSKLTQKDTYKRPISDASSLKPPDSPNDHIPANTMVKKEKIIKKAKIRSRSNSVNSVDNTTTDENKKPIEKFFTESENLPMSYLQFIYILDNFTNKSLNIHSLTEEANIDITSLMDIIDHIRPLVNDRSLKSRLTKLSNLLFQAQLVSSN